MQVRKYNTITKVMSAIALASSSIAIANTQPTDIAWSTTSSDFNSNIATVGTLFNVTDTSQEQVFLEQFSTNATEWLRENSYSKMSIQKEIISFKELSSCWDGEDAEPIAIGAINGAHEFLGTYHGNLEFDAFPDPDGSVGLQADFAGGRVILSFNEAGKVAYLIRNNKAIHRGHSTTNETINTIISSLL